MIMKRFLQYACLALCASFGSAFASTIERPVGYLLTTLKQIGDFHQTAATRLDIALAHWRSGDETVTAGLKSNLRAQSNHYVMATALPLPEGVGVGVGSLHC